MKYRLLTLLGLALCLSPAALAQTEISLIGPAAIKAPVEAVLPMFEAKSGMHVKADIGLGGTNKLAAAGAYDVSIIEPPLDAILAAGNLDLESKAPLFGNAVVMAVKKGAAKLDISTPAALKALLLSGKTIAYPDPADSRVDFGFTLKALGIADEVGPHIKLAKGGLGAMAMVASGEADIGFAFISQTQVEGIDVVGLLPEAVSPRSFMVGFVSKKSKNPAAAKALLAYLSGPEAAAVYKSLGMLPAGR